MLYAWKENSMLTNCLAACARLTITVSEIERDIGGKSSFFHNPLHSTPSLGGVPVGLAPLCFVRKNWNGVATRWWKNFEDIFIHFAATHERDRQTDRHCVPAIAALMHSIARQKCYVCWCFRSVLFQNVLKCEHFSIQYLGITDVMCFFLNVQCDYNRQ